MEKPRILHIISGLDTGGAEMMLYKLLVRFSERGVQSQVISLRKRGPIARKIEAAGITVHTLNLGAGFLQMILAIPRLVWWVREFSPSVIQGWMYHGNLFATISSLFISREVLVCWSIRQTLYDIQKERKLTRWIIRLCKIFSRLPSYILYNSELSANQHEGYGYCSNGRMIIGNGFDLEEFKPRPSIKSEVKRELRIISPYVVGHVARYHLKKDHETLLKVARCVVDEIDNVVFLLIGRGVVPSNTRLSNRIAQLDLTDHVRLLGEREDIAKLLTTIDVFVSSSAWGEGFPNVVGEAMATGVPCVVTDVGESRYIVGTVGIVAAPYSVEMIASGVVKVLKYSPEKRKRIGDQGRKRMLSKYSIQDIASKYLKVYGFKKEQEQVDITSPKIV